MNNQEYHIIDIIPGTSVDGPGLRTSIYFAGCTHRCIGCHNPQTWIESNGHIMTTTEIISIVEDNGFNVTLTGGDPLYNPLKAIKLAKLIKSKGYNIWLYTGYTFETISENAELKEILNYVDVIVDGPFISSQRDISLRFRGSANQRLIDVKKTQASQSVILWDM